MHKSKNCNLLTPTSYAQVGESKNKNDNFLEDHLKYNSTKFGANPPNILGGDSFLRKSPKIGTDNAHLGLRRPCQRSAQTGMPCVMALDGLISLKQIKCILS